MKKLLPLGLIAVILISGCVGDYNNAGQNIWDIKLLQSNYISSGSQRYLFVSVSLQNIASDHGEHNFATSYQTRAVDKEGNSYSPTPEALYDLGYTYGGYLQTDYIPYGSSREGYIIFEVSPVIDIEYVDIAGERIPLNVSEPVQNGQAVPLEPQNEGTSKENITFSGFEWGVQDVGFQGSIGMAEAYIMNDKYHTAQTVASEGGIRLTITSHDFVSGETLSYDIDYNSGSGNCLSYVVLDGIELGSSNHFLTPCTTPEGGCGHIGYWGGAPDVGDSLGRYHVEITFGSNTTITFTRPNGSTITHVTNLASDSHSFGFETRTGSDGTCSFDYYNFMVGG